MKLQAINTIYRKDKGKQVRIGPKQKFECPTEEAETYLALKAAFVIDADEGKAAPAKKATKKAEPAKAAEPAKKAEPAKAADDNLLGD